MNSVAIKTYSLVFLFLVCTFFTGFFYEEAYAQLSNTVGVSLGVTPRTPAPFSEVTVSLEAYSTNTTGASIRWYANGSELTAFQNERSATLTVGALGQSVAVRAAVTLPDGSSFSASQTITPATIDLIIEADSLTPSFYDGRALPVGGEPVSITAIPHFGGSLGPASYSYLWRLDQTVLFGGAVKGKFRIDTTMPLYGGTLSVVVYNSTGSELGSTAFNLVPHEPELYFYEENPLRGLSTKAVLGTHVLLGEESTFRAEPYFVGSGFFASNPILDWSIDGRDAISNDSDPATITLRKEGGSGTAAVRFSFIHGSSILQQAARSFSLYFE